MNDVARRAVPLEVHPDDLVVIKKIVVAGQERKLKKPLRVPAARLHDCQLVIDHIVKSPPPAPPRSDPTKPERRG